MNITRPMAAMIIATSLVVVSQHASAVEEPKYSVLMQEGDFETRQYDPKIIAKTTVTGNYDDASKQGFKILADYIFGNNSAPNSQPNQSNASQSSKISMTAPVGMTPASQDIAMTAPVSMSQADGNWQISFVMPSQYTMQTLPKPNNPAIRLEEQEANRYAVIKFSGFTGKNKVAKKTQDLQQWMAKQGLNAKGQPQIARYDTPWTLPFLRRNEVMIQYQMD